MRRAAMVLAELVLCAIVAALFWFAATANGLSRCLEPEPVCPPGQYPYCVCNDVDDVDGCRWVCIYVDGRGR